MLLCARVYARVIRYRLVSYGILVSFGLSFGLLFLLFSSYASSSMLYYFSVNSFTAIQERRLLGDSERRFEDSDRREEDGER